MELDALFVNKDVRLEPFHRWTPLFSGWKQALAPEPDPFTNDSMGKPDHGVHLQWQLPHALRQGRHRTKTPTPADRSTSGTSFPPIPNRWLVVRSFGEQTDRKLAAWVVVSDALGDKDGSAFPDPADSSAATRIGKRVALADWAGESGPAASFTLTAVGPGLLTFSTFQPYNKNVLSLHDDLADLTKLTKDSTAAAKSLSYLVVGWYSDQKQDVLTGRSALESLRWTASGGPDLNRSLYVGHAVAVQRSERGTPKSGRPDSGDTVQVAVGNSSTDALSGLLRLVKDVDQEYAALLEALQHGLLDGLDDAGHDSVDQSIHRSWFGAAPGGFVWEVVDQTTEDRREAAGHAAAQQAGDAREAETAARRAVDAERSIVDEQALAAEREMLNRLNAAQTKHDQVVGELADARWKLYGAWWLSRRGQMKDLHQQFVESLDPTRPKSLAARVEALGADVLKRRWTGKGTTGGAPEDYLVPWGENAGTLADAAKAYPKPGELAPHRVLRRAPAPEFHQPADPVLLFAHIGTPTGPEPGATVACRLKSEVVTSGDGIAGIPDDQLRPFSTAKIPEQAAVQTLITEFWLLDQAQLTGKKVTYPPGKPRPLPGATTPWTQPWQPLYLLYDVSYYPVPYQAGTGPHWKFDGSRFTLDSIPSDSKAESYVGRTLLTPHATFNLDKRIDQYSRQYRRSKGYPDKDHPPDAVERALDGLLKTVRGWDVLSQTLEGITQHMALRHTGVRARPQGRGHEKVAELVADPPKTLPGPRDVIKGTPPALRAGQLRFNRLTVVDRFGRACDVITDGEGGGTDTRGKVLAVAPSVAPGKHIVDNAWPGTWVQLPPRLFQGARLRFEHRPAGTVGGSPVNPVCGWVLPNHLDRSLMVFDPDGVALGETQVVAETKGDAVLWIDAPGSPTTGLDEVAAKYPWLGQFLLRLRRPGGSGDEDKDKAAGAAAHADLLTAIDETLFTVNPLGGWDDPTLTVLAGRPLALARAELRFELDGPAKLVPTKDNWKQVLADPTTTPAPAFLDYSWQVRLGSLADQDDGLIGYFLNDKYTNLFAVHSEALPSGYVKPIANGFPLSFAKDPKRATVTLLVDPRAAVHAVTDLLPATALRIEPTFIDSALGNLRVFFRVGPLLAGVTTFADPQSGQPNSGLVMPRPGAGHGTWTFHEPTSPTQESELPLAPVGHPATDRLTARTGRLIRRDPLAED
jgi:hypothetical protein